MPRKRNKKHAVDLEKVPRELIQQARPLVNAAGMAVLLWDLPTMVHKRDELFDLCTKFCYTPEEVKYILDRS